MAFRIAWVCFDRHKIRAINVKYYFLGPTDQKHECQSGGLHPPSKASVNEFVRVARRRIKYMSVCGTGGIMPGDIAAEVNLIQGCWG